MKLLPKYETFFLKISEFFSTFIRFILNALLIVVCAALIVGVVKSGIDLFNNLGNSPEKMLQSILLNTVFIVALIEIAITILGYLKDGKVHVRYIVDTILIIMLNEVVVLWYRKPNLEEMIGIAIIVLALAAIRIMVTKYAPIDEEAGMKQRAKQEKQSD